MQRTTGECITTGLRQGTSVGASTIAYDEPLRAQGHLLLSQIAARVHTYAPYWWKVGDGTVAILANTNKGTAPANFNNFGKQGSVWLQGARRPLSWLDPILLESARQTNPSLRAEPTQYTLRTRTSTGLAEIDVYPTPGTNVTLELFEYAKKIPELIDTPLAPGVAVGAAVGLTQTVSYRISVVHAAGETEAGPASADLVLANQKANLTGISTSYSRSATARKVYRNKAATQNVWFLAETLADNITTILTGEADADGALGAAALTLDQAVTGMEQFPSDFHETIFIDGLVQMLRAARKSAPFNLFSEDWTQNLRRMWADQRQDQHVARVMPPYGQAAGVVRSWRRTL